MKSIRKFITAAALLAASALPASAACWEWSKTAASNSNADSTINWAEGQAPSSVNDSARAMMARLAECRDDNNGSLTTGGTSTAYTLTTNQALGSTVPPNGFKVVAKLNVTNGASPTLQIDSGSAYPIRTSTGTAIGTGYMTAGGVFAFTFNSATSAWMVHSFFSIPVNLDLIGATQGSILYRNASAWVQLTPGTSGQVLTTAGAAANPSWGNIPVPKIVPQGYLTPTSNTPRISTDAVAATTIYYTPDVGNMIPIYNGTTWSNTEFAQLTLTLHSSQAANTIYDVCIFNDAGTVRAGFTPAWTTSTAGSGSRGTGAGTPQLTRVGGVNVNAVSMTVNNGATTYSVSANRCTYVGTVLIDGTAGQVTNHVSYGNARKWGIWNAYNRKRVILKMGDTGGATWNYNSSLRQSNGNANNKVDVVTGLAEEALQINFNQNLSLPSGTSNYGRIAIGFNSTAAISGFTSYQASVSGSNIDGSAEARFIAAPQLGRSTINSLEFVNSGSSNTTYGHGENDMLLTVDYNG